MLHNKPLYVCWQPGYTLFACTVIFEISKISSFSEIPVTLISLMVIFTIAQKCTQPCENKVTVGMAVCSLVPRCGGEPRNETRQFAKLAGCG